MSKIEVRMVEIEKCVRKREEEEQEEGRVSSREEETRNIYSVGSERGSISMKSEEGISVRNGLSIRKVERIKKWVVDKDREERKRNTIIKGLRAPREVINEEVCRMDDGYVQG